MSPKTATGLQPALYYHTLANQQVLCTLCPHNCNIASGHAGACGVRVNRGGYLFTGVGDRIISVEVDPIEKKPLFHYLPGSRAYSFGTVGCNFRCQFCQNWEISQWPKLQPQDGPETEQHPSGAFCPAREESPDDLFPGKHVKPSELIREAKRIGAESIAYTYTEPTIFFELALETARGASQSGLGNVFVTNGFIALEPLREIAPYLSAANIDLKSFRDHFYKRVCGARLQPVLTAIEAYKRLGVWIELTTLVIPGLNDDEGELREIATFIRTTLGDDVPWHVTRFYPAYRMENHPMTPVETLLRARDIGRQVGLRYVYIGNVPELEGGEDTRCHGCHEPVIRRWGFQVIENMLRAGRCPKCTEFVPGRWAVASSTG